MTRVDVAYDDCYKVINKHSKTFTKAFSLLPALKRRAVWAVYAFCREIDDIVDEGKFPGKELQAFEQSFKRFLTGEFDSNDSKWIALDDVFKRFSMDTDAFLDMIRGQRMDLTKHSYETMEELEHYSYHVASTVGLMLLPILAPQNHQELRAGGIALGLAMQLTNILRDVGEDLERNRIYLPADVMKKHGLTRDELMEGIVTPTFIEVWEDVAERAEELFTLSLKTIDLYPIDARMPVKASAYLYRAILTSVRNNNYDVFSERNYVSKEEKEMILMEMQG